MRKLRKNREGILIKLLQIIRKQQADRLRITTILNNRNTTWYIFMHDLVIDMIKE